MRDKTSVPFCVKTTTLKMSLNALRWALASLLLNKLLPSTDATKPKHWNLAVKTLLLSTGFKNEQRFTRFTFTAAEQKLLGNYLRLAFHFFETLGRAQFALFFKIQKGSNRKKTTRRVIAANKNHLKEDTRVAPSRFKASKKNLTSYWSQVSVSRKSDLSSKLLNPQTPLPVITLLQHTINLNQIASTKNLLALTNPQQLSENRLKLASANTSAIRRTYLNTLRLKSFWSKLLTTPRSGVRLPIPAVTTFLEREAQLYVTKELPIGELTAELKYLYPEYKLPYKALKRLHTIAEFRRNSKKSLQVGGKSQQIAETGTNFGGMLNKHRYFSSHSTSFAHQKAFNKLTPSLAELRMQQKLTQPQANKISDAKQALYVPTSKKIVKLLRRLVAARRQHYRIQGNATKAAAWNFHFRTLQKLSWSTAPTLKLVLDQVIKILQRVQHAGKINSARLVTASPQQIARSGIGLTTNPRDIGAAQLFNPLLKKFKQQIRKMPTELTPKPKSAEKLADEHKQLLALKKIAYFKELAFLKAQGLVKPGQLVKTSKPTKHAQNSKQLTPKTKKLRNRTVTSRILLWLLKFKKQKLYFLLTNGLKEPKEEAEQIIWATKLVAVPVVEETSEISENGDDVNMAEANNTLSEDLKYLKSAKNRAQPELAALAEKVGFQGLYAMTRTSEILKPSVLEEFYVPMKVYKAMTIKTKSFIKHLETVLALLGNSTKAVKRIFTSKFVKFQRPELLMFSPNFKSMRRRKTSQHFSGLALKNAFRWSAGSTKRALLSLKVLKKTAASQENKRLNKQKYKSTTPPSRVLLAMRLTKPGQHLVDCKPKPSSLSTNQYLRQSLQKYAGRLKADFRTAAPLLLIWTAWTRVRVKIQTSNLTKAAEHRRRYHPKTTRPRFTKALVIHPRFNWENNCAENNFKTPYTLLSKKQRQLLRQVSSNQTLNIFFRTRHKPVNFAKPWLLDSAIPMYTNIKHNAKPTASRNRVAQPQRLFTPPALLNAIKAKQKSVDLTRPHIATNWMPHKTLQARKAWTPQILSLFIYLSRSSLLRKNNKVWEQRLGFRVVNRFWPQSKKPRSKTFAQAKHATLKRNFRKLAKAVAVLRLTPNCRLKNSTGVLKGTVNIRRAPLHSASIKKIKIQSNPVQRLSTTRTYDMFKRFIFTFWRAQALFKTKFTPQKHWNRWKFKHKFWAWFKKQKNARQQYVSNQLAFPALWVLFVQLKWAITKAHALKLLPFDFFLHNGKKIVSLETPLAAGDIIQGPLGSSWLRKARVKELTTSKNYIRKYKRVQYVIKRSQWRKRRAKQKDVYTNLVHKISNSVPSWLQVDLFSNSFAVITAPTQFAQLGVLPAHGYTLQKLTPWRLKI